MRSPVDPPTSAPRSLNRSIAVPISYLTLACLWLGILPASTLRADNQISEAPVAFHLYPLLHPGSGELIGTGIRPSASNIVFSFGSGNDEIAIATHEGGDLRVLPLIAPSERSHQETNMWWRPGYATKALPAGAAPVPPPGEWTLFSYTDNDGTTLPELKAQPLQLNQGQQDRLRLFPSQIPPEAFAAKNGSYLGGLIFEGATPIAIVGYSGRSGIRTFPVKDIQELKALADSPPIQKDVFRAMLGEIEWPEGKPTLAEPSKPLQFRLLTPHGEPPPRITVRLNEAHKQDGRIELVPVSLDGKLWQCLVDTTPYVDTAKGVTLTITAGETHIQGQAQNDLLETAKGTLLLADLPLHLDWKANYRGKGIDPADLVGMQGITDATTGDTLADWSAVDSVLLHKLRQFVDLEIAVQISAGDANYEVDDHLKFDLLNSPTDAPRSQGEPTRSIRMTQFQLERKIPARDVAYTSDGSHLIFVNAEGDIEIVHRQTLSTVSVISTHSDRKTAETYCCDATFLYLLDDEQQRILSYTLPSGQFHGAITHTELGLGQDERIHKIAAHRLGTDECVLLIGSGSSTRARLARVDTRAKRIIFSQELHSGPSRYNIEPIEMVSPLFAKLYGAWPLYTSGSEASIKKENSIPLRQLYIETNADTLRYREQKIALAALEAGLPNFRWTDRQRITSAMKRNSGGTTPVQAEPTQAIFVNEPVYLRSEAGQTLDAPLPVYADEPLDFQIWAGPKGYEIHPDGRLTSDGRRESSLHPDFLLIRASNETTGISFWVAVDRR